MVPLEQTLGIGEAPILLGVRGRREEEDLGADVLGAELARLYLGAVQPPRGALDHGQVAHDQPVQVRHPEPLHLAVGGPDSRVLPGQEVALHAAVELALDGLVGAVIPGDARQVVEAELVLRRRRLPPPRLEQTDEIGPHVPPLAGAGRGSGDEVVEALVVMGPTHR